MKTGVCVKVIPTIPLKEMSFARVLVPLRSAATRLANVITLMIQILVDTDSTTVIAREVLLNWYLSGHMLAERIHPRRLTTNFTGRT